MIAGPLSICSPFWGTFLVWQRALWVPSSLKTTSTIRHWPKNTPMILLQVSWGDKDWRRKTSLKLTLPSGCRPGCGGGAQRHDWARPGRTSRAEVHRTLEVAGDGFLWRSAVFLQDWCTICHYDHYAVFGSCLEVPSWKLTLSPPKACLKMIFLFPRWDMLVLWRVDHLDLKRVSCMTTMQRCLVGLTWGTLMQLLDRRAHDWTWSLQSRWEAQPVEMRWWMIRTIPRNVCW